MSILIEPPTYFMAAPGPDKKYKFIVFSVLNKIN
jgi:hypothetical protein